MKKATKNIKNQTLRAAMMLLLAMTATTVRAENMEEYIRRYLEDRYIEFALLGTNIPRDEVYCPNCGFTYYNSHSICRYDVTCIQNGIAVVTCKDEYNLQMIRIPAPGSHDWGEYTHVDATCTEAGGDQHTCNRCGVTEKDNVIPALGHDYSAGGHVCTRCNVDAGPVSYIDSDGTEQTCDDYTFITGSGDVTLGTSGATAWYAIYGNVSLTQLSLNDKTANLILADGAKLTIDNTSGQGLKVGGNTGNNGTLNIYRQSSGSGSLSVTANGNAISANVAINIYGGSITATSTNGNGIKADGDITITGGNVSATATSSADGTGYGIRAFWNGTLTITGGNVTATGGTAGMGTYRYNSGGNINLSWTNSTDRITTNSFELAGNSGGSLVLSKDFIDEEGAFHTPDNIGTLAGKTLAPAIVLADDADNGTAIAAANGTTLAAQLNGRTLYRDGDWNTLCLPFNVPNLAGTPLAGFTVMELDTETGKYTTDTGFSGGTLTLNFKDASGIVAGRPYIVKRSGPPAYAPTGGTSIMQGYECYQLMDGSNQTMWMARMEDGMAYCDIRADEPFRATTYALTTRGNVYQGNNTNPTVWSLKAKLNESDEWTVIDSRNSNTNSEDALPDNLLTPKEYTIQQPGDYQYYRLEVTGVAGGNIIEVMEMTMQGSYATNIVNPVFAGVTLSSNTPASIGSDDGKVSFVGIYSPVALTVGDKSNLYLGASNTLYWPNASNNADGNYYVNACRAYFHIDDASAATLKRTVLNFGDEGTATGVASPKSSPEGKDFKSPLLQEGTGEAWYDLYGRRLNNTPRQSGIYIVNGRKVVIK